MKIFMNYVEYHDMMKCIQNDANVIDFQFRAAAWSWDRPPVSSRLRSRWSGPNARSLSTSTRGRLMAATKALHAAVLPGPNEITIKFFR
jgi:hypothetical protein